MLGAEPPDEVAGISPQIWRPAESRGGRGKAVIWVWGGERLNRCT